MQMKKLQEKMAALDAASASSAPLHFRGPWVLLLKTVAVAARAAAAASSALTFLYCAVTSSAIRNALYNTLAAEPGSLRLPVLAVLGLAAFVTASISSIADHWMASSRA